jgi:hypothetical protein
MVDDGSSLLDPRRDGSACGTLATSPSSRFCKRHEALAQKWGEVRVLSGDDSGNAPKKRRAMMVEVLEPEAITPALVDANGDVSAMEPAGIRPPSLARLASSNLDAPQRACSEPAPSATTTRGVGASGPTPHKADRRFHRPTQQSRRRRQRPRPSLDHTHSLSRSSSGSTVRSAGLRA